MFKRLESYAIIVLLSGCVAGEVGKDKTVAAATTVISPSVTSVTPTSGNSFGGTVLSINGANFNTNDTVSVGTASCAISVVTSSAITCTIATATTAPWGSGLVNVSVTKTSGKSATLANAYTWVHSSPSITSFNPTTSLVDDFNPTVMTITGDYFRSGLMVTIGSTLCTSPSVVDRNTATCDPATIATPTAEFVSVTNDDMLAFTSTAQYSYIGLSPTIGSIWKEGTPTGGAMTTTPSAVFDIQGGETMIISGTGFYNDSSVYLDGTLVAATYISGNELQVSAPAKTPGTYAIYVMNSDNQSSTPSGAFTFTSETPYLTSMYNATAISPTANFGPLAGGYTATLSGVFNAASTYTVTIDKANETLSCTGVSTLSGTDLTCTVPATAAGTYTVHVQDAGSLVESTATIAEVSYQWIDAPSITGTISTVNPVSATSAGTYLGSTTISIPGSNFLAGARVIIDPLGTPDLCSSVNVVSANEIQCVTNAHTAGTYDIDVTNLDAQAATATLAYSYVQEPSVTGVVNADFPSISYGNISGATLTISGTDFDIGGGSVTVSIAGAGECTGAVVSGGGTQVDCNAPAVGASASNLDVSVMDNSTSLIATMSGAWSYVADPTMTAIYSRHVNRLDDSLSKGPIVWTTAGEYLGTLTGSDFGSPTPTLTFGGNTATITGSTATTMDFEIPDGSIAGSVDVVMVRSDGSTATATGGWEYVTFPTITLLSPTGGGETQTTTGSITGTGFTDFGTVQPNIAVGSTTNAGTYVSATEVNFTASPNSPGVVDVIYHQPDGQITTKNFGFSYIPAPTITSFTPTGGSSAGGTGMTITGANYIPGSGVSVVLDDGGDNTACSITSPSIDITSTTIYCTTSVHAGGTESVDIKVTNSDGQWTTLGTYAFQDPPTVTNLSLDGGPLAGGNTIYLTGTGFYGTPTVTIDPGGQNVDCAIGSSSSTTLDCVITAGGPYTAGTYDVRVANPDGQFVDHTNSYSFLPAPTITPGFSPIEGPSVGGTTVTITGTGFIANPTPTVNFDYAGTSVACGSVIVSSATSLTCVTGAHAGGGPYDVEYVNYDSQTATVAGAYTYRDAPTFTSMTPTVGRDDTTTFVTVTGNYFYTPGTTTVNVGGIGCTGVTVNSATELTCTIQTGGSGISDIAIQNPDTQTVTSSGAFNFRTTPTLTAIEHNLIPGVAYGPVSGSTTVKLTGSNFNSSGMSATIDGSTCTGLSYVDANTMTCVTPAHAAQTALDVIIYNDVGQGATLAGAWDYVVAPTISSVTPTYGFTTGTQGMTITGTGFDAYNELSITATLDPGVSPTDCTISSQTDVSPTSIYCTRQAHGGGGGIVDVRVTNADGQSDTLVLGYTFRNAPTVTGITPSPGDANGGESVTISGTDFWTSTLVMIGDYQCTGQSVVSSSQITCTTGSSGTATGTYDVVVTNGDGQVGTGTGLYQYSNIPTLAWQLGAGSPNPPNPDDYGNTGGTNVTHTFTLENTGSGTSSSITVSLGGTNPGAFFIGTDNCSGNTLAGGATCTVQVTFLGALVGAGSYTATIDATATSGGSTSNQIDGQR